MTDSRAAVGITLPSHEARYHPGVEYGDQLRRQWEATARLMPEGWTFDSIRCASVGLVLEQRSDQWRAVALGPQGSEAEGHGASPEAAMADLVDRIRAH